ncbi:hypothetical protein D9M69_720110 [compost metagenome]
MAEMVTGCSKRSRAAWWAEPVIRAISSGFSLRCLSAVPTTFSLVIRLVRAGSTRIIGRAMSRNRSTTFMNSRNASASFAL